MKTYALTVLCANHVSVGTFIDALVTAGATEVRYHQHTARSAASTHAVPAAQPARSGANGRVSADRVSMADHIEDWFKQHGRQPVNVRQSDELAAHLKRLGYKTSPDSAVPSVVANYDVKIKKVGPSTYQYAS